MGEVTKLSTKTDIRVSSFQAIALAIDEKIEKAKVGIQQRKGVVAGLRLGAESLKPEIAKIQKLIDTQSLDMAEGRIKIDQLKSSIELLMKLSESNTRGVETDTGRLVGLEEAWGICDSLAKTEINKERARQVRAERNPEEFDSAGRPRTVRELRKGEPSKIDSKPSEEGDKVEGQPSPVKAKEEEEISSDKPSEGEDTKPSKEEILSKAIASRSKGSPKRPPKKKIPKPKPKK